MCTHEQPQLVGTAEGIRCRACGKVFNNFAEIERDRAAADAPAEKPKTARRKKTDD